MNGPSKAWLKDRDKYYIFSWHMHPATLRRLADEAGVTGDDVALVRFAKRAIRQEEWADEQYYKRQAAASDAAMKARQAAREAKLRKSAEWEAEFERRNDELEARMAQRGEIML
jgi:hypothetical protein